MTITFRDTKGSDLDPSEVDANWRTLTGSGGASQIGFLSSGTGAISRPVQTKLRELGKSPEDFGAVGDGSTDDTTAIQAWVDSVPTSAGATDPSWVLRPSAGKKYKLTNKITVGNKRIAIIGNGMTGSGSASIFYQSDANKDFFDAYTGNSDVFSVYGCMFLGTGKATGTGNAIRLGRSAQYIFDSQIHDCWFADIPNACIYGDYIADLNIQNCGIEGATYGIYIGTTANAEGDINKIIGCTLYSLTYGIFGASGTNTQIVGNQFLLCGTSPGGTGDNVSGGIVLNKTGSPSVRATLISSNSFRANTNDIITNGNSGSDSANTGVNDVHIVGNTSDRAYRRFVGATDTHQLLIVNNLINSPSQESDGTYAAIDLLGACDKPTVIGNKLCDQTGAAIRPSYGLSVATGTTNLSLGQNDFSVAKTASISLGAAATFATMNTMQGTWTPVIAGQTTAGTQSYTTQAGKWVLLPGPMVWITGQILLSALDAAAAGNILIKGLPFPVKSGDDPVSFAIGGFSRIVLGADEHLTVRSSGAVASSLNLIASNDAGALSAIQHTDMAATSEIDITGIYRPSGAAIASGTTVL